MNPNVKIIFGLFIGASGSVMDLSVDITSAVNEVVKTAGERMKKILSLLTKNPILGVLAGALTTAVLQSSSATTVMAISL